MKQKKKRAVKFLLAAFALISAFGAALTVNAAAPSLSAKNVTVYENSFTEITLKGVKTKDIKKGKVICDVQYSKPEVADVYVLNGAKKNSYGIVYVHGNTKGTVKVTITVKYGKNLKKQKKLRLNVKVKKRANPCASFKVGKQNYAPEFAKADFYYPKKLTGKMKVSIKAKKGWRIVQIYTWNFGQKTAKKIKNNKKINTSNFVEVYALFEEAKTKTNVLVGIDWADLDSY